MKGRRKRLFPLARQTKPEEDNIRQKSGLAGNVQFDIYQLLGFDFLQVGVSQVVVCNGRRAKMTTNKESKASLIEIQRDSKSKITLA